MHPVVFWTWVVLVIVAAAILAPLFMLWRALDARPRLYRRAGIVIFITE